VENGKLLAFSPMNFARLKPQFVRQDRNVKPSKE